MAKKRNSKKKDSVKPLPKIKYEDTVRFKALDMMMRQNRGIQLEK